MDNVMRSVGLALIVVLWAGYLVSCSSLPPASVSDFCTLMLNRLPIIVTRTDAPETKRQALRLNEIYKNRCIHE